MTSSAPSAHVKPSANPFRSRCVDALRYQAHDETVEEIAERFARQRFRGALIGPHGHGKSTLLRELSRLPLIENPRTDTHPVVHVRSDVSNLDELRHQLRHRRGVLMVDGYDLLPRRWRWAVWNQRFALVTAHQPTRLPTLAQCQTTPELLGGLIARLAPGVRDQLGAEGIAALHRSHCGNLRDALRELYDRYASGEFITSVSSA